MKKTLLISSVLLLQACAGLVSSPRNDVPVEEPAVSATKSDGEPASTISPAVDDELMQIDELELSLNKESIRTESASRQPAVLALLNNAVQEQDAGNLVTAAVNIERALRLEPKNAVLWSRLAGIRLEQGNWQQAYVLANKSNSLGRGDNSLQIRNWRIIELAKTRQGDREAADAARARIRALGG